MAEQEIFRNRQQRAREFLQSRGIGSFIATSPSNLYYFTGVWLETGERASSLILSVSAPAVLVVHEMFQHEASLAGVRTELWKDGDNPFKLIAASTAKSDVVAIDGSWATRQLLRLLAYRGEKPLPVSGDVVMGEIRTLKDEVELSALRRASEMADSVECAIRAKLVAGNTEAKVAQHLAEEWQNLTSEGMSFPPIVAAGTSGASPHHEPDDSRLVQESTVIVDTGGIYRHYCSDITRTYILGTPSAEVEKVYKTVLAAQEAGIAAAKPGVTLEAVDAAVRKVIVDAGYGEYFTHRTGHGVGLDIHEAPFVVSGNSEQLRVGMVMSVEPGIYLPGKFGVRIEDLIVITEDGAELLNHAPKQFEEVIIR